MGKELELYLGPMKSGKSNLLIARMSHFKAQDRNVLGVQPDVNSRDQEGITSRLFERAWEETVTARRLGEVAITVANNDVDVIGVDEAFMFEDPQDFRDTVEGWLYDRRRVIIASLDVLGNQTVPPVISKLMELAPRITQIESSCDWCKDDEAIFTIITDESGQPIPKDRLQDILVEGETRVDYAPACRTCYQKEYSRTL